MIDESTSQQLSAAIRAKAGYGPPEPDDNPAAEAEVPDFDGGARSTAPTPPSMSQRIRKAAGY